MSIAHQAILTDLGMAGLDNNPFLKHEASADGLVSYFILVGCHCLLTYWFVNLSGSSCFLSESITSENWIFLHLIQLYETHDKSIVG